MDHVQVGKQEKRNFPMGLTILPDGFHISVCGAGTKCYLILFSGEEDQLGSKIPFPIEQKQGHVWQMTVTGFGFAKMRYCFELDGHRFADPYGYSFYGHEGWGELEREKKTLLTSLNHEAFDWEGDQPLGLSYQDSIIYRAHVRGLTQHPSSKVMDRGTFLGVIEKIPYLQELGITTLELMPVIEFDEVIRPDYPLGNPYVVDKATGKINYWGYTGGYYFAPKAAYTSGQAKYPINEFKRLVKVLHQAGIELIIELYFTGTESPSYVLDAARFWVREYHIDGIHFIGNVPVDLLGDDPYLATTKLWAGSWNTVNKQSNPNRAVYRQDFQDSMRKFLKGDEDQLSELIFHTKHHGRGHAVINYMAHTNGLTMMDMVSYDRKHNELNGEQNKDGNDYNYSWNCGIEGSTKKKKIVELRKQQLRNAITLLMLSQGTPLILAGDEFGNSQQGNNNAYCQDNDISWINWKQYGLNQDIYQFVKAMIAFRKKHPVFRQTKELKVMDYLSCGHPDISYHGEKAWCPKFEHFRRELGMMYCGLYAPTDDQLPDNYCYVIYNMHWEKHIFALPHLPRSQHWYMAVNTGDIEHNHVFDAGKEPELADQRQQIVPPRTIIVLIGR